VIVGALLVRRWCAVVGFAAAVSLPGWAQADDILVFAPASLGPAVEAAARGFADETGHQVTVSAAGSSVLARQILQGAPADIFISADEAWMDAVSEAGRVSPESRVTLVGNALVLIAHGRADGAPIDHAEPGALTARLGGQRVAVALTEAVPAGRYARAALTSLGAWEALRPGLVEADNVRGALALVATGAAPYGIVYATDARAEPRVTVIARFAPDTHPPIVYPAALVGDPSQVARDFLTYLQGPAAQGVFAELGFVPAGG
jgi:molybdate transport system substrate-binding protein